MSVNEPVAPEFTLRDRIDEVCDAFEQEWQTAERPQIAAFVALGDQETRAALFCELLLVELEFRLNRGEKPLRDEYLQTFPEFSEQIAAIEFEHGRSTLPVTIGLNASDTPRSTPLQPGTPIAHFQLIEKIGSGAMGEVWKARDTRLHRLVAIKLPRAGQLNEADLHRFLREGRAAAQLRHPQLAAVHDAGREGDLAYIVADYVEGDDLKKHLANQRLDFSGAAALCADVAEALHHAHERGVVHRDLKPANIIIDKDGRPHVIDFGLAKWASDDRELTVKGELLGTPAYMAPEQARGDVDEVGPSSDVYAMGAMLYELIAGRCPFSGGRVAVIQAIVNDDPEPPRRIDRTIPRDLETICLKAIEKDQKKRYHSASEMAVDLRRFTRGEPILARRVGRVEKTWRWLRRRPAVAASILLVLVAAGAILAASSFAKKNRELLGFHTVSITTEPVGARVAFARLTEAGELIQDQVIIPSGVTPVRVELLPGDYFVEAVLPDGRFHQVFRHVPKSPSSMTGAYNHDRIIAKNDGSIGLMDIKIPHSDVTQDMQLLVALDNDDGRLAGASFKGHAFFVDRQSITIGEVRRLDGSASTDDITTEQGEKPVQSSYDEALNIAERLGKRLPTSREYARLATGHGAVAVSSATPPEKTSENQRINPQENRRARTTVAQGPNYVRYEPALASGLGFRCVRSSQPQLLVDE